ncbi:hypothetical protein V6N13_090096 [Hibiscus sabdariffa]|uniref:Uncharacterized protein n=1 Tax=Hibiscus sabdariffa TaxID=183260 RepID=A0ABR2QHU8_9ROSI
MKLCNGATLSPSPVLLEAIQFVLSLGSKFFYILHRLLNRIRHKRRDSGASSGGVYMNICWKPRRKSALPARVAMSTPKALWFDGWPLRSGASSMQGKRITGKSCHVHTKGSMVRWLASAFWSIIHAGKAVRTCKDDRDQP